MLISETEGSFYGNSVDNNEKLITQLENNVFSKKLLAGYKHDKNGFIFDICKAGQLAFLMQTVQKVNENGVSYEKLSSPKISFMSVEEFEIATRRRTLGREKITVLHHPQKEFKTVEGETAIVVKNKFIKTIK